MASRLAAACCLAIGVGSTTALAAAAAQTQSDTSVETTLAAMRSYLAQYRQDLTFVIADELASQRVRRSPRESNTPEARTTTSTVHFRFVEDDNSWMAIREVQTVDGQPAERGDSLAVALRDQQTGVVARNFKTYNSRFNIGKIVRTFNEPTLPLNILDPDRVSRFKFKRERSKVEDGVTLVTLSFREEPSARPFIYDLRMQQAQVRGEFLVEAGTGRIRKTTLNVKMGRVRATLTTTYALDGKLDLWVPLTFTERYQNGIELTGVMTGVPVSYEQVYCESTYSNFQRFSATARIK